MEQKDAELFTDETVDVTAADVAAEQQLGLSDDFIRDIVHLLEEDSAADIREKCAALNAPDAAELLTKVGPLRHRLVDILEDELESETFSYLSYEILNDLFGNMSGPHIAAIVGELESDDAIHLIDELDETRRSEIMRHLSRKVRAVVEEGLNFPEESAGRLMQREFVAIPQFWTVGKTADYLRAASESLPDKFYDIFIVDPMHKYIGSVTLSDVLCTQRSVKMESIMDDNRVKVPVTMDQEQVAQIFRRKDLLSAPVVDDAARLIGVITVDDIVDVIDAEAEEDLLSMGGVTDSDIYSSSFATARSRSTWLLVNLITAFVSASVISLFEASIEKVVALAVLMPIVASMGGNAGTQTLTVAVRALATKELSAANAWRVIGKECIVGMLNGVFFALLLGLLVAWWFSSIFLGAVIASALMINLLIAGFFGAFVPITLTRMKIDPAPAAGIFLTMMTDVIGFFAFLGLATVFLL
ncbi:MAG: magnesium transporter [Bdellovibrionales bacterium]|jgi:magnesium transporter|nr:magnesium transporter [Bdellovibrionales bacterium]